jgi:hypothetical protein
MRYSMKTLALLITLLALPFVTYAQDIVALEGSLIESAEVSGLALDQLSPGLRRDISALTGQRLSAEVVTALAYRIEAERPEVVSATRGVLRPEGKVRVIFLVARIAEDEKLASNINARYAIEAVEIEGIPESKISQALRDDAHALAGKPLDPDEAERLEARFKAELPDFDITKRIARGSQPGQVRLIFEVAEIKPPAWIPYTPSRSKLIYHADLGWTGALDIPVGGRRNNRVTFGFVFGNGDDLIEEYSGYGVRFESRKVATDRLGVRIELSRYRQDWQEATLSAVASDPRIPEAYRTRVTVEPAVTFAFNPHLRVSGGVSITELESVIASPASQMASATVAAIDYRREWAPAFSSLDAGYELRAASTALGSDLEYTRHVGRARYEYRRGKNGVKARFALGRITGDAPLFERFSLGDSSTLRGWNKFDVAPAGGRGMFHQSVEFDYKGFALFLDSGSVWEPGADKRLRFSTGFGYHHDGIFLTLGVPLNADEVNATFMAGVRF